MTIAVAALWPFGPLKGTIQLGVKRAVILVADSRWTWLNGGARRYEDVGIKLFQLGQNVGAVYAGHVDSGEECLSRLARRGARGRIPSTKEAAVLMSDLFTTVYQRHHTAVPLRILVGACDPRGIAQMWLFASDNTFQSIPLDGVQLLAFPETERIFREALDAVIKDAMSKPKGLSIEPDRGALWIAAAVHEHVLVPGVDITVGGKIQTAIIDSKGFRTAQILQFHEPIGPNSWQTLTPVQGELRTLRPRKPRDEETVPSAMTLNVYKVME